MEIFYKITKSEEGFVAECTNQNIVTQGDSLDEVIKNLKEAIELHLQSKEDIDFIHRHNQPPHFY